MVISMLKIRRPLGRLIFNMGIAIPGKTIFLIETAPCLSYILNITMYNIVISNDLETYIARASAGMEYAIHYLMGRYHLKKFNMAISFTIINIQSIK